MRQSRFGYAIFILCAVLLTMALQARAEDNKGSNYYDLGIFAFEEEDYKTAERHFKMALGADPDKPQYNYFLGKTYLKLNQLDKAKQHFDKAWIVDPDISGLKYDRGMLYFKKQDYSQASRLFIQAAKDDPDNVLANYYSGLSLFREEKYGDAVLYFNKAEKQSPSVKDNAHFYAGICYRNLGRVFQAKSNFIHLRGHAESDYMKQQAQRWLDAMDSAKKVKKPYLLYGKVGMQYNDNVRLRSSDDVMLNDDLGTQDDDFSAVAFLSGRFDFLNLDKFKIGAGYSHYQTMHFDLSQYDLMGAIPTVYLAYRKASVAFHLNYLPSFYWLDSEKFLTRHHVRPELTWELGDQYTARFTYNYYKDDHEMDADRTGDTHEFGAELFFSPVNQTILLFAGADYGMKSADQDYQSYDRLNLKAGINYTTDNKFDLTAKFKYCDKSYDKVDPAYKQKRDAGKIQMRLSVSRSFIKDWLKWMAEFKHDRNDTTIPELDYERNVFVLSIITAY